MAAEAETIVIDMDEGRWRIVHSWPCKQCEGGKRAVICMECVGGVVTVRACYCEVCDAIRDAKEAA